jgi:hypothetical protein
VGLEPATFSFNCHLQARLTSALLLPLSPILKWHGGMFLCKYKNSCRTLKIFCMYVNETWIWSVRKMYLNLY